MDGLLSAYNTCISLMSFTDRLVAVPEPSIIALFALGLVGVGFARRRQS
jgi:hypothetical protein